MAAGDRLLEEAEPSSDTPRSLAPSLAFQGKLVYWIGLFGTSASLFKLGAAAGLWLLQPWGWRLVVLRATLKLLSHLVAVIQGAITPSGIGGLLVNGTVVLYLSRPCVRQALSGVSIALPITAR
jgi:uncharacterized membrane protein (DUF2068 family)